MMNNRQRLFEKKSILFLLLIYMVFLGQEVVLTQVWCLKYDGTLDLEYSLFDYHCHCAHTCSKDTNLSSNDMAGSFVESFPGKTSCFNIPSENSRLVRMKTDTYNVDLNLVCSTVMDSESVDFPLFCDQFYRIFPLSKFIYIPDYRFPTDILLC
jgi:hypothetical protein